MGTAWSLATVHEVSKTDILTIHGDLLLSTSGLSKFLESTKNFSNYSIMSFHRRNSAQARSIIELESDSFRVRKFDSILPSSRDLVQNQLPMEVLSNSGLYLFRSRHLNLFDKVTLSGNDIVTSMIPKLIAERVLVGQEFVGPRLSIEDAKDLRFAQDHISQFN